MIDSGTEHMRIADPFPKHSLVPIEASFARLAGRTPDEPLATPAADLARDGASRCHTNASSRSGATRTRPAPAPPFTCSAFGTCHRGGRARACADAVLKPTEAMIDGRRTRPRTGCSRPSRRRWYERGISRFRRGVPNWWKGDGGAGQRRPRRHDRLVVEPHGSAMHLIALAKYHRRRGTVADPRAARC